MPFMDDQSISNKIGSYRGIESCLFAYLVRYEPTSWIYSLSWAVSQVGR